VLLVTGVVLSHNTHRSTALLSNVPDGPVYPIGMGPATHSATTSPMHARRIRSAALSLPPAQQALNEQTLVDWEDPRSVFEYFADGDDWITEGEAKSAFDELGMELSQEEVTELFNKFDTDGDGKVSWPEFEAGFALLSKPEAEEEEEPAAEPVDSVAEKMEQYAKMNPVYGRCAKQADLTAFNAAITKTCGNIHELGSCSYPCTLEMQKWSTKMGCCFETVLDAYKFADPTAEHSWRLWQGTMSGKCGVTFEDDNCGESVGEHGFRELEDTVGDMKGVVADNQQNLEYLSNEMYYNDPYNNNNDPYSNYNDPYSSNPGAYDDYYDSTDFYGDNYDYPSSDSMVPPSYYKGNGPQSMHDVAHGPANGKRGLGDEVMDMPAFPGQDMGDVHVPSDKVSPYMYSHGKHMHKPGPSHRMGGLRVAHQQSLALKSRSPQRTTQLVGSAYADSINYMNTLRIKEGMRGKHGAPTDPMMPHFGESWQGSAKGGMSDAIASIAPPTPGESWQGKATFPLQSLDQKRGLMPSSLPFEARTEEQRENAAENDEEDRQSEEEDVAFPMARGIVIGGDGSMGIGRPAAAAVDRMASPTERAQYTDADDDGHNRLTPSAAVREARYENNWDNAQNEEQKHPFAPLLDGAAMDEAAAPRRDKGTKAMQAAGIRV